MQWNVRRQTDNLRRHNRPSEDVPASIWSYDSCLTEQGSRYSPSNFKFTEHIGSMEYDW